MQDKILENGFVYSVGSFGYVLLEVLWRGYTHWTMAVTGGICFLAIYKANLKLGGKSIILKCFAGAAVITAAELLVGILVNIIIKWNVWDYSSYPLNYLGQICLMYSALWFLLGIPLSFLCRFIRKRILFP